MSHLVSSINWDILMSTLITPICLLAGAIMFTWWLISATYWELSRVLISLLEVMRPDLCVLNKKQINDWKGEYASTRKRLKEALGHSRVLRQVVDMHQAQSRNIASHAALVRDFHTALAQKNATIRELQSEVTRLNSKALVDQDGALTEFGAKVRFAAMFDALRDANRQNRGAAPNHNVAAFAVDLHPADIRRNHGPQVTDDVCRELERRLNTLKLRPSDIVTKVGGRYFLMFHHVTPTDVGKVDQRIRSVLQGSLSITKPGSSELLDVKVTPTVLNTHGSIEPKSVLGPDAWFRRLFLLASERPTLRKTPTLELVTAVFQGQGSTLALAAA